MEEVWAPLAAERQGAGFEKRGHEMKLHRRIPRGVWILAAMVVVGVLSAGAAPDSASDSTRGKKRDVRFVVIHAPGPKWVQGKSLFEQPGLEAHIAHYRKLLERNKLMAGGPFLDDAGGGMMIPEPGLTESEIAEFARTDPAVIAGVLTFEVRPWLVGMKK